MSPTGDDTGASSVPDASDEFAFRQQVDRVVDEKRRALADPGPSWREWWFHSGSKWYVGLAFLIFDVWVVGFGLEIGLLSVAIGLFVLALYGEFLLYRYLYYEPEIDVTGPRTPFRRTWYRPVEYGRWTAEGEVLRAGGTVVVPDDGPDPKEFL